MHISWRIALFYWNKEMPGAGTVKVRVHSSLRCDVCNQLRVFLF